MGRRAVSAALRRAKAARGGKKKQAAEPLDEEPIPEWALPLFKTPEAPAAPPRPPVVSADES